MKRILLTSLMSCMLFSQIQCDFQSFATGFLASASWHAFVGGLNYVAAPGNIGREKVAVDAAYYSSMCSLVGGGLSIGALGFRQTAESLRVENFYTNFTREQVISASLGVAAGSLVGFAGCCVAWYKGKI